MPDGEEHPVPSEAANTALSTHLSEPVRVESEASIPHFDVAAIHLVTSSGLDWIARRLGSRQSTPPGFARTSSSTRQAPRRTSKRHGWDAGCASAAPSSR